jgi:hypothetical protein
VWPADVAINEPWKVPLSRVPVRIPWTVPVNPLPVSKFPVKDGALAAVTDDPTPVAPTRPRAINVMLKEVVAPVVRVMLPWYLVP